VSGLEELLVERLPHWPFVAGAYAAFFLLLLADALQPLLAARRLRRELAARLAREARRGLPSED
jgi:heme exporter protein CcmD